MFKLSFSAFVLRPQIHIFFYQFFDLNLEAFDYLLLGLGLDSIGITKDVELFLELSYFKLVGGDLMRMRMTAVILIG